ncbi:MAG TPA: carbamoyl phosphate synthase small subunit, partial [Clostridia bacterium]|nr:carbamoyl phosphate synthase small subunit [Clostridia bacterium]
WQSEGSIKEYFFQHNIIALDGIDTRSLTKKLRTCGSMPGVIACGTSHTDQELIEKAQRAKLSSDLVSEVSTKIPYFYNRTGSKKIAVVDLGVKKNILNSLAALDCQVMVYPYKVKAEEILASGCHGVLFSNGPGDPKNLPQLVETAKQILGKLPVMGIGLGHQIICLSLGADTYKLKFGHRGGNQPVKDLASGKITITSQNHSYAVLEESLINTGLYVSHRNLNDNTVEGVSSKAFPLISVQYHPETAVGFNNNGDEIFTKFLALVSARNAY